MEYESMRYSLSFKQQVVAEIESGKMTIAQAEKTYHVSNQSIYGWLKQLGKEYLIRRRIFVATPEERKEVEDLKRRNRELESALAKTQVKVIALESLIEVAEEHYKADFKKNFGPKGSNVPGSGSESALNP
jgi:transposase